MSRGRADSAGLRFKLSEKRLKGKNIILGA